MLISSIGLLEPIQNQDHRIIPGCPGNPYRFIHTKCPLSPFTAQRHVVEAPEDSQYVVVKRLGDAVVDGTVMSFHATHAQARDAVMTGLTEELRHAGDNEPVYVTHARLRGEYARYVDC